MKSLKEKLNNEFDDLLEDGTFDHLISGNKPPIAPKVSRSDFIAILTIGATIALEHQEEINKEEIRVLNSI